MSDLSQSKFMDSKARTVRAPRGSVITCANWQIEAALRMLQGWDGSMDRDSGAAALYEVWSSKSLRSAVLKAGAGDAGAVLATPGDNTRMVLLLENPSGWVTNEQRDAL
eukprot:gene8999-12046_t